jgi:hypothetical protein
MLASRDTINIQVRECECCVNHIPEKLRKIYTAGN